MHDIIIVGAGLAGSGLAHRMAADGWDVLLLERDSFPRHKVCGEFLSPEAQSSLRALGLHDAVAQLGPVPMRHAALTAASGRTLRVELPGDAWGLTRYALDAALAEAAVAAGATLCTGASVASAVRDAEGVRARYRSAAGEEEARGRVIVTACGRHSPKGLRARPARDPERTGVGVKCHITGAAGPAEVELFLFDGGYAGLAPVGGGRLNLCMLASRQALRRAGGDPRALVEAAASWCPALGRRLAGGALVEETLVSVAPVDTGDRPAPWGPGPRVGDAAVMIPPLCGDGMAMALRSAELCAPLAGDALAGRTDERALQGRYTRAWRREFLPRVLAARALQAVLASAPVAEAALAAGALLPPLAQTMVHATRGRTGA